MAISVQTIIEINNFYQRIMRTKKLKATDRQEINELLAYCALIISTANPNHILTDLAANKLFELIYNVCLKKHKDIEEFIDYVIEKSFSISFFKVLIQLKKNNVYSEEIFKLLWKNQVYNDDAFLQLIDFMISSKQVEQSDVLQVGEFPQKANYIYLCLVFLKKYNLTRYNKSLYERAEFADTLWKAWNHLVDNKVPFHEELQIPDTILDIFRAMFLSPWYSLELAKGVALIFRKYLFFDYYKMLCDNPKYALELAQAFVMLTDPVTYRSYREANLRMIIQHPQHATEIASALNLLMTKGIYNNYHKLLQLNPHEALVIAKLVSCLTSRELLDSNIYSAVVDNIGDVVHVYNIVAVLSHWSSMMNVNVLHTVFENSDYIPEIAAKLLDMSVKDNLSFDGMAFNKMIDDIKVEKRKSEEAKEKKKQEEAGLIPKAKISPLEEIRDYEGALNYLKENVFNKKEKLDKKISIEYIKNAFRQLLQVGLNVKTKNALTMMTSLFYLINVNYNKGKVNIHKNLRYDAFFGKTNTNAWVDMMKVVRDQAYQLLMELVENEPDISKKIELLEEMKIHGIFSEHRTNSFFNRFHETATVKEIDKKIAVLRAPNSLSMNK